MNPAWVPATSVSMVAMPWASVVVVTEFAVPNAASPLTTWNVTMAPGSSGLLPSVSDTRSGSAKGWPTVVT
jgi:hypothetical protein